MSIDRPSIDPEALVRAYLAECSDVSPEEIEIIGFRARAAVLVATIELHASEEVSMRRLLEDFRGNERYSVADCVEYINMLVGKIG